MIFERRARLLSVTLMLRINGKQLLQVREIDPLRALHARLLGTQLISIKQRHAKEAMSDPLTTATQALSCSLPHDQSQAIS